MSIWDIAKNIVTEPFKLPGQIIGKLTGADAAKKQQQMMNEQIKAYKEQTELSKSELNRAKDEQVAEKRRVQEKQIRSLRRGGSSKGFLGSSNEAPAGMNSQLGG